MRKMISILGDSAIERGGDKYNFAFELGKALVDNGYRVASGGLMGVMEAVFEGAHASKFYREGDTVAISPSFDRGRANPYADIVIATGLDIYRNVIVANSDAVVVVGGGSGTLAEIATAWSLKRLMLAYADADGWSGQLADKRVDKRIRYENIPEDRVYGVHTADEAIAILEKYIGQYTSTFPGIRS